MYVICIWNAYRLKGKEIRIRDRKRKGNWKEMHVEERENRKGKEKEDRIEKEVKGNWKEMKVG